MVTALTTPPIAPPYSAEMPAVFTCTSCTYSNTVFCRERPLNRLPVTTPSIVKVFSAPLAPFTWNPPSSTPALTEGAVAASDWKLRVLGSRAISSAPTLCATVVVRRSMRGDALEVTCTASARLPTSSVAPSSRVLPRNTVTAGASRAAKPARSKRTR